MDQKYTDTLHAVRITLVFQNSLEVLLKKIKTGKGGNVAAANLHTKMYRKVGNFKTTKAPKLYMESSLLEDIQN